VPLLAVAAVAIGTGFGAAAMYASLPANDTDLGRPYSAIGVPVSAEDSRRRVDVA
jgi:hypothetical protein